MDIFTGISLQNLKDMATRDEKSFKQILQFSIKNSKTCPVVYKILKELAAKYGNR